MKTRSIFIIGLIGMLISCGGGGDSVPVEIHGKATGLDGTLVIQTNDGEKFTIKESGDFSFKTSLKTGDSYSVRVIDEPCKQRCDLDEFEGKISDDGIIDVHVFCGSKSWSKPESISDFVSFSGHDVKEFSSSINDYGEMLVAWSQPDSSGFNRVYKREFENGEWAGLPSASDAINPKDSNATNLTSILNTDGTGSIAWIQTYSDKDQLFVESKSNGIWVDPQKPVTTTEQGVADFQPIIKTNNSTNGFALWVQQDGSDYNLYKADIISGAWSPDSTPKKINTNPLTISMSRIFDGVINDKGDAIIVWQQQDSTYTQIYYMEKIEGSWTGAKKISASTADATSPIATLNNLGDGMIAWFQGGVDVSYRPADKSWGPATQAAVGGNFQIAMNDAGYSIAIWTGGGSMGTDILYRMDGRNGVWNDSSTQVVSPVDTGEIGKFQIVMDNDNNAAIVWTQTDEPHDGELHGYLAESSNVSKGEWTHPTILDPFTLASSETSKISIELKECRKLVTWTQYDAGNTNHQLFIATYR